jgi:hypothetical protein
MPLQLSPELKAILASAFTSGTETSLQHLSALLGWPDGEKLSAAAGVVDFVSGFDLEFVPDLTSGEFETSRVLRMTSTESDGTDAVRQIMLVGERSDVEFKSSLMCSMYHWKENEELREMSALPGETLKTICAFLNTDGGELLVGVDDDGASCGGIQRDLDLKGWNIDRWQLHMMALITGRFDQGHLILPYIRMRLVAIDSFPVARISVMARSDRSFVRREKDKAYEYFLRNGPRTDSLDLPEFYEHLCAQGILSAPNDR